MFDTTHTCARSMQNKMKRSIYNKFLCVTFIYLDVRTIALYLVHPKILYSVALSSNTLSKYSDRKDHIIMLKNILKSQKHTWRNPPKEKT
mmetsp:Transcript_16996/g.24085  ORF Transcript_16996/g.24085 Transcript_16996/m.24085 type:complete len:90 (+) Transcript_16996:635-904(+)